MFKQQLSSIAGGMIILLSTSVMAADSGLKSDDAKFGYALGTRIGQQLKAKGLTKLDTDAFSQAVADVMKGRKLKLSDAEMAQAFQAMEQKRNAERASEGAKAKAAGEKFLATNKAKPGVVTLENGLQYRVITEGKGPKPTADDVVSVNYRGTLIDGTEFDSSYSRGEPAQFPVKAVIPGWQQILQLMPVGSKWQVVIPSQLAYGETGAGGAIGPNETLVFEIELLKIVPKESQNQ